MVMVCRAQVSPGNPIGPSGVSRLAWVLKKHRPSGPAQLAVTCISTVPFGVGIDVVAVFTPAAAVGASSTPSAATEHAAASAPTNFFTALPPVRRMLARALFVVGDFHGIG